VPRRLLVAAEKHLHALSDAHGVRLTNSKVARREQFNFERRKISHHPHPYSLVGVSAATVGLFEIGKRRMSKLELNRA
jgi:hypothetical protein